MSEEVVPKPGEARCPGVSVQDLLDKDSRAVPVYLREQSYEFLGDEDIPFERYTSKDYFDNEVEHVWPRTWQWACREEHIPQLGDYYVYDVGPYSVIVMRTQSGAINAYRNSCMHRGTKLKPSFSSGWSESIRCSYHGWDWHLDGQLKNLPCVWDFPHVDKKELDLSSVACDVWGGFVFINLESGAVLRHRPFRTWTMKTRPLSSTSWQWGPSGSSRLSYPMCWQGSRKRLLPCPARWRRMFTTTLLVIRTPVSKQRLTV